ncbi:MAG: glycosyltransferase family 2 protein [Erysipelotrichales bacterium]|nr:glycosyltransferase family 2 protein [Erysipelotrichales bacterium]
MKLNVVIPLYNEENNIIPLYDALTKSLKGIKYTLIFVDDGSIDKSLDKLTKIYNKNKQNIKVIGFSRNFGKEAAMFAGLKASHAEYTCIIDADLQQNPKYIVDMLKFLEDNPSYDEVAMVNDYSKEKRSQRFLKKAFYKVMSKASGQKTIAGASDFRLMRECVVDALISLEESNRFSKGLFAWVGFNTFYMTYAADKRHSGVSKFKLKKQFNYAKDGLFSFSTKPLKIATILGSIISFISFLYFMEILLQTIISGKDIPGYASIMCVILILGGIQLIVLGIIGEYIAKSYLEIKRRPIYVAKTKLGFDEDIL